MTSSGSTETAAAWYLHGLEPRPGGRVRRVLLGALDLWCAQFGGRFELTGRADVVVRDREDGREELRIAVGSPEDAAATLHRVGRDLERLTAAEFRERWHFG